MQRTANIRGCHSKKVYFCRVIKTSKVLTKKLKEMKKVLCICAVGLLLGFFTTSCDKKCQCKNYINGALSSTDEPFEVEAGKKCSDYNSTITLLGVTTEKKCKVVM